MAPSTAESLMWLVCPFIFMAVLMAAVILSPVYRLEVYLAKRGLKPEHVDLMDGLVEKFDQWHLLARLQSDVIYKMESASTCDIAGLLSRDPEPSVDEEGNLRCACEPGLPGYTCDPHKLADYNVREAAAKSELNRASAECLAAGIEPWRVKFFSVQD